MSAAAAFAGAAAFEQPTSFPDPKGGVHGCTPFSDRARDGESENPLNSSDHLIGLSRAAVSFGYFSLGKQRKVTRPRQRAEALAVVLNDTPRQEQRPWIPACAGMTNKSSGKSRRTSMCAALRV
ncbi:hypothetical protein ACFOLC_13050 [Lysobacter cavernae]|uniref:Uncharacterized protein n=1 Tax=Lysobacter cavernae TaxID=1685901 RepID=A0ABV7RQK4_9GAMM